MPILMLAVVALAVFVVMGFMLFGAILAERREREKLKASAPPTPQDEPGSKTSRA
jgi:hypothetical protein